MSGISSPDDSPKEDEHDWDSYLIETNSEAAPVANFRQALILPVNEFTEKEKVETVDPRNQDSWCIGTIVEKDGPRLRLRLDGTDDRNDFWRLVDSADIRCYGKTEESGGQIVPPLGFQQNSSRWKTYFEKKVQHGPFAAESCFKPQPPKPEKNFFKVGQKLEAVDPRHPSVICPATISKASPTDRRIEISLDGWSSSNNFKVDYSSRDIFPVGWCKSAGIRIAKVAGNPPSRSSNKTLPTTPNKQNGNNRQQQTKSKKTVISPVSNDSSYSSTTMDEKNNNLTIKNTSSMEKQGRNSIDLNRSIKKERPIVTVYLNYHDDNSGMLLNPYKFRTSMPSIFGPNESHIVLTLIFDSCIKCAFQQTSLSQQILQTFPTPKADKKDSYVPIKLENGSIVYISELDTEEDFWDVIGTLQNDILSCNDLFISTQPLSLNNQSNGSFSSFLDSSTSPDKKESSPSNRLSLNNQMKRKSTELTSYPDDKTLISNGKNARTNSNEKSVYDTKSSLQPSKSIVNGSGTSRRLERFTPNEVASFIRGIDPSFDSLATRFLQEEIDGKALVLLTTDTLMKHMGLKLGPSLKIVHHIEQLKKSSKN